MKTIKLAAMIGAASCALGGLWATPASAQASRTWVSGVGNDADPCSRTAPCKTFAGALIKTAAGGEINCLDPAGFGTLSTTKSITVDCTGTLGGNLAASATGVTVNGAGIVVTLRGLEINGGPPTLPGINGVRFLQGAQLSIEDSTIFNFISASPNGWGVIVNATSGSMRLYITNTTIRFNGAAANLGGGIAIKPTGSTSVRAMLRNVRVLGNNGTGLLVDSSGNNASSTGHIVSVEDSVFSGNTNGISMLAPSSPAFLDVLLDNVQISGNTTSGIRADGAAVVGRVANSTIVGNGQGLTVVNGATLSSYGTNRLNGNPGAIGGNDGAFTGLVIPTL